MEARVKEFEGRTWVAWAVYDSLRHELKRWARHRWWCLGRFRQSKCLCGLLEILFREGMAWRRGDLVCKCGRGQSITDETARVGCSIGAAELVGWRNINGRWECPYCTGNTANLNQVFNRSIEAEGETETKP